MISPRVGLLKTETWKLVKTDLPTPSDSPLLFLLLPSSFYWVAHNDSAHTFPSLNCHHIFSFILRCLVSLPAPSRLAGQKQDTSECVSGSVCAPVGFLKGGLRCSCVCRWRQKKGDSEQWSWLRSGFCSWYVCVCVCELAWRVRHHAMMVTVEERLEGAALRSILMPLVTLWSCSLL